MDAPPGPLARAIAALVAWIVARRGRAAGVLALCLLLGAGGLAVGASIRVDTDLKALLPPESPSLRALDALKARTGATEAFTVAVRGPDDAVNAAVIAALAEEIGSWEESVGEVTLGRDFTPLRDHGLYFMPLEDLQRLRDTLIEQRQRAVASAMSIGDGPAPDAAEVVAGDDWDTFGDDPLPVDPAAADAPAPSAPPARDDTPKGSDALPTDDEGRVDLRQWLRDQKANLQTKDRLSEEEVDLMWLEEDDEGELVWEEEVIAPFISREGDARLLQARLDRPATNVRFAQEAYARVQATFDELVASGVGSTDQQVVVVGAYDVSADFDQILVDLGRATWVSALLVLLVLAVGFRRLRGLVLVLLPLVTAMLVTLGIAQLAYGELNALTAFLFAVLFGMGVDFAVHLFSQRRAQGVEANWPAIIEQHLRPLVATMATTTGSLFVLSVAVFKAFREFGAISGVGVVVCFVFAVIMVPALDTLLGPHRPTRGEAQAAPPRGPAAPGASPPASLGWWRRLRWALLGAAAVIAVLGLPQLDFERDTERLKAPEETRGEKVRARQGRQCNKPLTLVASTPEALDAAVARLEAARGELLPGRVEVAGSPSVPWIDEIFSLSTSMPEAQGPKAKVIAEIGRQSADFLAQLPDLDDEARSYRGHLEALERLAGNDPLTTDELPDWAAAPFTERDGTVGRLAHVCLRIHAHELDELVATSARLDELIGDTGVLAADSRLILADLLDLVQRDARRLPLVAMLVILAMIAIDLRRPWATAACFGTLALGLGAATGLMGLWGMHINFFNLVVMPAVVGLGIDASIHLWHARDSGTLGATGQGSLVAALTTLAGFSGLLVAQHPGLRSIGEVGVVCIIGCVGLAFVALHPAGRRTEPPAE